MTAAAVSATTAEFHRQVEVWISQGARKLGWCWAGNPHTWPGSASCGGRLGVGVR
jgi:hypothetical protein